MSAEVSGRAFLGILKHVLDTRGRDGLDQVVSRAGEGARAVLAHRIRVMGWYPYDAYVELLRALDRRYGGGDGRYCRELGRVAGQRDLGTIFRVYAALASPERLIRSCSRVWPSYHRNAGAMEAVRWEPSGTALRITGFTDMAPEHCRLMEGWMLSVMEQIGIEVHDWAETACSSRGDEHHEFTCRWSS